MASFSGRTEIMHWTSLAPQLPLRACRGVPHCSAAPTVSVPAPFDKVADIRLFSPMKLATKASAGRSYKSSGEAYRSEERRVGKECGSPCRLRGSPYH